MAKKPKKDLMNFLGDILDHHGWRDGGDEGEIRKIIAKGRVTDVLIGLIKWLKVNGEDNLAEKLKTVLLVHMEITEWPKGL